jgi:hypothetical protein
MSGLVVRDLATSEASTLTATERLVALCIAYHMRDNPTAWPSYPKVARWCGLSLSGVRKALATLCATGGIFERSLRPGRAAGYEYRLREAVTGEQCHRGTVSPHGAKGVTTGRGGCLPVTLNEKGMSEGSALAILRAEWSELIGAPSRFFDGDVGPLVTTRRPTARVVEGMRAYAASVDVSKASSRAFAQGIEGWLKRPNAAPEPYRGTPEQLAEKSRRYLEGGGLAS